MKVKMILATTAVSMLTACGGMGTGMGTSTKSGNGSGTGSVLGGIIGAITNGEGIGNAITSVLGFDKVTAKGLVGAWHYAGPGCAFTSENMLAKAGGEMAAVQVKEKLKSQFDALGFTASNTSVTFTEDGKFAAKIGGRSWSGTWTLDESTGAITLKGLILSIKGYTKRSVTGISLLFESKKLLSILQTIAAISGNSTVQAVGDLSKNYDGVRLGFEFAK